MAYYGSFIKASTMWICMEFCAGGSVSDMYNCTWPAVLSSSTVCHVLILLGHVLVSFFACVSRRWSALGKPLFETEIAHILYYSLQGLDYLHASHKIHRDIKVTQLLSLLSLPQREEKEREREV